jgi:DNA-directed RNA polymerase specialized sigma24 family protein
MPTDLPLEWGEYARLQTISSQLNRVDGYAWGLDAAMDRAIEAARGAQQCSPEVTQRVTDTVARRERQRAFVRAARNGELVNASINLVRALEARDALRALQRRLSQFDWALIYRIAQGFSAKEVSRQLRLTPVNVRVRVSRLRSHLQSTCSRPASGATRPSLSIRR